MQDDQSSFFPDFPSTGQQLSSAMNGATPAEINGVNGDGKVTEKQTSSEPSPYSSWGNEVSQASPSGDGWPSPTNGETPSQTNENANVASAPGFFGSQRGPQEDYDPSRGVSGDPASVNGGQETQQSQWSYAWTSARAASGTTGVNTPESVPEPEPQKTQQEGQERQWSFSWTSSKPTGIAENELDETQTAYSSESSTVDKTSSPWSVADGSASSTTNGETRGRIDTGNGPNDQYLDYVKSTEETKSGRGGGKFNNKSPKTGMGSVSGRFDSFMENIKQSGDGRADSDSRSYGGLLKKHLRLALTGGVPLDREMTGERLAPDIDTTGMTERIMRSIVTENQATGAGGASSWEAFQRAEASWARLKEYMPGVNDVPPEPFVTEDGGQGNPQCFAKLLSQRDRALDFDIAVCGGTLGIFFATALQLEGHNVCVVEAGKLRGREQEWNISMDELFHLKSLGVLSQEDIDDAIQTDFPGCRSGFKNKEVEVKGGYLENGVGYECFTEGVLNLGVSPKILIERVSQRFQSLGGVIVEETRLQGVCAVKEIGAALDFGAYQEPVTARLIIDAMGNNSPITRQQRYGKKPDGICAVVGTCASGYEPETNLNGDIIYTNTPIQDKGRQGGRMQYFWEAFPVGIGRNGKQPGTSDTKTTYMFTYMDAHQRRPTLESILEDYWRLLPQYQPSIKNPELDLDVKRVLFAYFPTYRESPLQPEFNRILAVGDASGIQSPLSFGGFGALTRHLGRITTAVTEALEYDLLTKQDLAKINPYTPNLSATWMFQKVRFPRIELFINSVNLTELFCFFIRQCQLE